MGEQALTAAEKPREVKDLFPLAWKDIQISLNVEREGSLCPWFMKSESSSYLGSSSSALSISVRKPESKHPQPQAAPEEPAKELPPPVAAAEPKIVLQEQPKPVVALAKPAPEPVAAVADNKKEEKENERKSVSGRNHKFTKEEDERIVGLVRKYGEGSWSQIAVEMGGRNRKQIRERYVNFLKKERSPAEFSSEEDALILTYVQEKGRKWSAISDLLPGRTPIMIKNRYYAKLRFSQKSAPDSNSTVEEKASPQNAEATSSGSFGSVTIVGRGSSKGDFQALTIDSHNTESQGRGTTSRKGSSMAVLVKEDVKDIDVLREQAKRLDSALKIISERIAKLKQGKRT